MITQRTLVTTSSTRLRLPVPSFDVQGLLCVEGPYAGAGTTMSTIDVSVPAFAKGDADPCVRAWSPPV